jgi:hypothetical protein
MRILENVHAIDPEATAQLRAFAAAVEPLVGAVYFSPEAHEAYAELGFAPSPGRMTDDWGSRHWGRVMMTDMYSYFCSRGAMLGQVPGEVIAAAFGVFKPSLVIDAVTEGWKIADADSIWEARDRGATAQLVRVLGERPDGIERATELLSRAGERLSVVCRPMYAGLLARGLPEHPVTRVWRLAERLREFRGDAHIAAFTTAGLGGAEIQILTERCAGFQPRTYAVTRGWEDADFDATEAWLTERGWLDNDGVGTEAGLAAREEIEQVTDHLCISMTESLGDEAPELVGILAGWAAKLKAADAYYPSSPQEALMTENIQEWMERHGFQRFSGMGLTGAPA